MSRYPQLSTPRGTETHATNDNPGQFSIDDFEEIGISKWDGASMPVVLGIGWKADPFVLRCPQS